MESQTTSQPSALGRFFRGFISGGANSLLMMGILYTLLLATTIVPVPAFTAAAIWHVVAHPLLVVAAIGIFTGVKAAYNGNPATPEIDAERGAVIATTTPQLSRAPTITPPAPPTPVIQVSAAEPSSEIPATASETPWSQRPGIRKQSDSIAEILANREMSSNDRAAAILAEREQAATAVSTRS